VLACFLRSDAAIKPPVGRRRSGWAEAGAWGAYVDLRYFGGPPIYRARDASDGGTDGPITRWSHNGFLSRTAVARAGPLLAKRCFGERPKALAHSHREIAKSQGEKNETLTFNFGAYLSSLGPVADRESRGDEECCSVKIASRYVQSAREMHIRRSCGGAWEPDRRIRRDGAANGQVQGLRKTNGLSTLSFVPIW